MNEAKRAKPASSRRLMQLYSALLYNAHLRGFVKGEIYQGRAKALCVPGLNCYSCPGAVGACPLGALQNELSAAGHRGGWYVIGILLLQGVVLGRTICGWLCPFGLVQELLHKLPAPKLRKSGLTRALSLLKYAVLALFVVALPLWSGLARGLALPAFCKYFCPAGTFEGAMGILPGNPSRLSMLGALFTHKFVIMLAVGLACVFAYRAFCRFLCPLGAIYGLFNRFNVVGVRVDAGRCNRCGACVRGCGMDVRRVGDRECIHCGRCMDACARGAISIRAGTVTLKAPAVDGAGRAPDVPRRQGRARLAVRAAALAVLCFALVWFNALDPSVRRNAAAGTGAAATEAADEASGAANAATETADQAPGAAEPASGAKTPARSDESDAPVGHEVGQRLEDFTATCYDGSTFRLSDARGKIVFINLWATWCAPCVQELPYFDALTRRYGGDVAVLAVHSPLVTDDPAAFVADKGYAMPFAADGQAGGSLFDIVGGSATLPQTLVLDRRGVVVYNQVKSVTPEALEALYEAADQP